LSLFTLYVSKQQQMEITTWLTSGSRSAICFQVNMSLPLLLLVVLVILFIIIINLISLPLVVI